MFSNFNRGAGVFDTLIWSTFNLDSKEVLHVGTKKTTRKVVSSDSVPPASWARYTCAICLTHLHVELMLQKICQKTS